MGNEELIRRVEWLKDQELPTYGLTRADVISYYLNVEDNWVSWLTFDAAGLCFVEVERGREQRHGS